MWELQFGIYFCGMSEETFSEQIMIYKPSSRIVKDFTGATLRQLSIVYVSELIDHLKNISIRESMGTWELDNFSIETVYIQHHDYLLGLQEDKPISSIFQDLETHRLEFAHFIAI